MEGSAFLKRQHDSGKKLLSYSVDFNYLKIAVELGRGHLLCICIQMILPAIWFVLRIPIWHSAVIGTKTEPASSFHLFHLALIGFVGAVVSNPSHQKAFYTFLLAMSNFQCSWSNQLAFFLIELIQKQLLPPKECYFFEFYCFAQRLSICITIIWNVLCQPISTTIKLMGRSVNSLRNFSVYPPSFKSKETRGHAKGHVRSLM